MPKLDDAPGRILEVGSGLALQGIPLDAPVGGDGLVRVRMDPVLVVVFVHKQGRSLTAENKGCRKIREIFCWGSHGVVVARVR